MDQTIQDEIISANPYFENLRDYLILVTKDIYDELNAGPKIKSGDKEISVALLKEFLTNEFAYSYMLRCANKEIGEVNISYIFYGDTMETIRINRTEFIRYADEAINNGLLVIDEEMKAKLEILRSKMTYETFKLEHGETFRITIDGNDLEIEPTLLIKIVEMSDEEFIHICLDDSITHIGIFPKRYVMYATLKFFNENVQSEYLFPKSVIARLYDLKCNKHIDIQSVNKHTKIEDKNLESIIVNEQLRRTILGGMPENLSKIEQAIFIYIKMCKILTYDEEFFALNQKGAGTEKHREISYISSITPDNNEVVCFEFNAIYAKLLEELGIKFTIDYKEIMNQEYGVGHELLEWRYHKFLVKADSCETFFNNDMMLAKLNQPLKGLNCINYNEQTRKEFEHLVSRIYQMIALKENKNTNRVEYTETLEDLLEEYSIFTTNIEKIPLSEKIDILFKKIANMSLSGIDILAYMLQLKKVIFSEEEQKDNINIVIVKNNDNPDSEKQVRPVAVIVINPESLVNEGAKNEYLLYDSDGNLSPIGFDDLKAMFDNQVLDYIDPLKDPVLSGIGKRGMK